MRAHMSEAAPRLLQATSIEKSFAGVRALKGVSFDLLPGEVHALVGENGAGKSTLIKIITGAEQPDAGTLAVGRPDRPAHGPGHVAGDGHRRHLSAAVAVSAPDGRGEHRAGARGRHALAPGGLDAAPGPRRATCSGASARQSIPDRLVETLSMPEQQIVEIAKAIGADAKIVLMDEPTASLTEREVESLFAVIARLRSQGVGVIYISHRLEEIFTVSDRITVLRDGQTVATRAVAEVDRGELIRMMVGREVSAVFPKREIARGAVALEIRGVSNREAGIEDVTLTVHRGEILGLAGLVGSGRTELAETIFGLTPADAGEILVHGARHVISSPADAIRAGIAYVPEDRRQHGVVLDMSVAANASLASLGAVSTRGLIDRGLERTRAQDFVDRLRIKTSSVLADVGTLSGGNQQKVALARWLSTKPSVIILDEPTQGVDVGSKAEIHGLMQMLAERGARDPDDFVGAAGDSRDERSHRGHARRRDPRRARPAPRRRSRASLPSRSTSRVTPEPWPAWDDGRGRLRWR